MDISKTSRSSKSTFHNTTFDINISIHVDRIVGSASISPSGRDVVLASTDGLDIIDLENPLQPPRHFRNGLPWLVADVQWSPFAARDYWVVSTANQKALVWNLNKHGDANGCVEHTLYAHKRAITDINFSAHHPDILATCAVDGYVHTWDLRRPKKPVITYTDWFGGATQVKYNRQDSHIIASSHDKWLRIWDDRNSATPVKSIDAHASKIYGVDWNRIDCSKVVTCSLDKTIKFWDYTRDFDEPERVIHTNFPVWRARHTPFGYGILAMPQDAPGDLHLYDQRVANEDGVNGCDKAVKVFQGCHNAKLKEFLWRSRGDILDDGTDAREFQLVSWGDDNKLRLQTVGPSVLAGVGYVRGTQAHKNLNVTRKGAAYKTFRVIEKNIVEKKVPTITLQQSTSYAPKIKSLGDGAKKMFAPKITKSSTTRKAKHNIAMKVNDGTVREYQIQQNVDWMSGIRNFKPYHLLSKSYPRYLSPSPQEWNDNREWEEQESLHDEIIRIHSELSTITFDRVDMDKRTVVASLNGPWAEDESLAYTKVTIIFPPSYPGTKPPIFTISKSSLMSNLTHSKIRRDVMHIANSFAARGQGCLETIFRYLLGDINLKFSTSCVQADFSNETLSLSEESFSDDEDNFAVGDSFILSDDFDTSTSDRILPVNRNANIPIPRLCGASFSASGKLVCFFPPKEDKVKSLLATVAARNKIRLKGNLFMGSFGRLPSEITPVGSKTIDSSTAFDVLSDFGDSDHKSSDSSDSDSSIQCQRPLFLKYMNEHIRSLKSNPPTTDSLASSAAAAGSGTGKRKTRPKNTIAFYSITDIIPSKIEFARDYVIFGKSSEVCEHNATIAEKYGHQDLAEIWRYAATILHNTLTLKSNGRVYDRGTIYTHADRTVQSNFYFHTNNFSNVSCNIIKWRSSYLRRVNWGKHPLAAPLIDKIFDHFERKADIQMLALLSCIFCEPSPTKDQATKPVRIQPQVSSMEMTDNFDRISKDTTNHRMLERIFYRSGISTPKLFQRSSGRDVSADSLSKTWISNPALECQCGDASLISTQPKPLPTNCKSQSLSVSPEASGKTFRSIQSSVGLASTFAANFSRFASSSTSPPKPAANRKKISPVEQILSSLAPSSITWGNATVPSRLVDDKNKNPLISSALQITSKARPCTGIKVIQDRDLQGHFDKEGHATTTLLNSNHSSRYLHYRALYAELLYLWGYPIGRLEVLKSTPATPAPGLEGSIISAHTGLNVIGYCIKHECSLERLPNSTEGDAVGRCEQCKLTQRQLRCTICLEPVSALFAPCLACGCVNHVDCLAAYIADGSCFCPGGCDCQCTVKSCMEYFDG
ncbi:BgTH12-07945 [Blumeria graminis f. sp. triticale]|uniref:Bgt-4492 n=3 Tax=Blumeria graminis TaxID=34373 RepID=A0A061HN87_BLUGR|nr:hypothetical protein BGT96224_4492 [Blumeria graminis f. sp. tritici 96224]CAD6503629.1 BgTH12-07945 [Blumeria graminis f. sp. triticale]VDB89803.1 Bgt-4492 [Blumeria graminis f. sp. tritici]